MKDFGFKNQFSREDIENYRRNKPTREQQYAKDNRSYMKDKMKRRAEERAYYPPIEVGFGGKFTHTFLGDAEDGGSSLDYNA